MSTLTNDEQLDSDNKTLETAVRNTAIQMGCWTATDDYLLITSILHLCDLERVHERVKFSMPFTLENIRDRWQCLLYDASISKMIITKIQQLSMLQLENLRIPFSEEEERLIATIPSHTIPAVLDNELDTCLSKYSQQFWSNRTIEELRECWSQLRQQGRLTDQSNADNSQVEQTTHSLNDQNATANKLSSLLAPFEFELLSRNKEQFVDKDKLPHALLHVHDHLYCMYTDQLNFGTDVNPDIKFDISFDNSTSIHIKGMIIYKSGLFYIINNGENAFRVNDALLNPNEASPLGTRAIINILEHTMVFQAIELS
ncbi:unnamed protein product [Adineta steineri]|uniref:Microspherule protein N-terminal domain-containing protein n=1 Tax=Adineta steineri TaxID=433720 RepID=A0A818IGI5_9BILA|nr:unnamed protein product [Adineta steineri]CAF3522251.1 unnamed protein product [Adineta steineri]